MCGKSREDLRGSYALRYIEWGESREFDKRPSCNGRKRWWDVGERMPGELFWPYIMRERLFCAYGESRIYVDCNLFDIYTEFDSYLLCALCNTTITILLNELSCRTYGGGGGPLKNQVYEVEALPIISSDILPLNIASEIRGKLVLMGQREILTIFNEIHEPDRRALDGIIFDALGLTTDEREAVYEAVADLVRRRLEKARSV